MPRSGARRAPLRRRRRLISFRSSCLRRSCRCEAGRTSWCGCSQPLLARFAHSALSALGAVATPTWAKAGPESAQTVRNANLISRSSVGLGESFTRSSIVTALAMALRGWRAALPERRGVNLSAAPRPERFGFLQHRLIGNDDEGEDFFTAYRDCLLQHLVTARLRPVEPGVRADLSKACIIARPA